MAYKKTICVDFDGVLNNYKGWKGENELFEPRNGAHMFLAWLKDENYEVVILTTRPADKVRSWLASNGMAGFVDDVTNVKVPAVAYIDDRAILFDGSFSKVTDKLSNFKAHWEE